MRSTDEQLQEIMRRSEIIKEKHTLRRSLLTDAAASGLCLALLIAVILYAPVFHAAQAQSTSSQYGSLLLATPYIAYIIVAVLAFAAGICITLLCYHWKRLKEQETK